MKRQILFTISFCLLLLNVYSQKDNNKNLLSLSFGPSIPIGGYGNTNLSNENAGFAKVGETINISFKHKLSKHFGIAAMLYGQKNAVNTNAMAQQFGQKGFAVMTGYAGNSTPGQPLPTPAYTYVYYPNWTFDKNNYYLGSFLIGGTGEFFIDKTNNLSFISKIMVGITNAAFPELNGQGSTDTSAIWITQNKVSAFGLSYLISVGLKYQFTKKWNLLLSADYVGTGKIKFKNETETIKTANGIIIPTGSGLLLPSNYSTFGIESTTGTGMQTFQSININLGIGLCF